MSTAPPIVCVFDGESFVPKSPRLADRYYGAGEIVPLVRHEDRSTSSHNHYFAALHEGWQNLPEHLAEHFPTDEHLRKYALIKAGYRDERSIACASKAEAQRVAAFIKPIDEYAIVTVSDALVTVYTAKSQSKRAMGAKVFQESKEAVLDIISAMIGAPLSAQSRPTAPNRAETRPAARRHPQPSPASAAGSISREVA